MPGGQYKRKAKLPVSEGKLPVTFSPTGDNAFPISFRSKWEKLEQAFGENISEVSYYGDSVLVKFKD